MIADAGDEGSQLCRSFDRELPASEDLANEIATFITRISHLFALDEPVCVLTGYTHHMITLLSEREILLPTLDGKSVRSLGGPGSITAELVVQCLKRMQTWVRLAKMVIQHEFPEWDLVSAFQLFNVTGGKKLLSTQTQETHINRISKFFDLDVMQFRTQFYDLAALARVHAQNASCDSFSAWQAIIKQVLSSKKRRDQHPCDAVQVALSRWAAWSPSSSGVEQSFGHLTHFATARQSHASEACECNEAVLLLDHCEDLEEQQIALARKVWAQIYPSPRTHKKPRLDKGISRSSSPLSQSLMTETTWIRNRRKDVDDHVSARHSDEILDDDGTDSCWGNTHEKEAKLQAEGRLKRKVQALRDGVLLPSEADQELEDYIQRMKVPLAANQLTTKEKNKNILYAGPKRPSFLDEDTGGRHVMAFVCQGAGTAAQKARDLGMQIVHDPGLANIILAKSFKSIPEIVLLCAVLRGCYIMDAAALDGCARSLCCKLCPTTQLKRKVWVSADFKEENNAIYTMLRHVVDECTIKPGWHWLDSVDECLQGKGVKFMALVTQEQQRQEASLILMDARKDQ
ncbi:unnamed protein product [Durusdinium trenchii]|uniref:Uncharacterized protein n=1 Tax=Durusdinium trenchii TaxID=1381693 RepID=A0ABP0RW09_9DINO